MKAAVVSAFGDKPRYADVPEPTTTGRDEVVVDVVAAALSPRVRSQAAGTHYTSSDELPLIPGIDGVGRLPDGGLVYFLLPDTNKGAMAERTVVDVRRTVALPRNADPVTIAAVMNPAMASWVALRQRVEFRRGQSVLILGATGNAGRCAVQVAQRLGAKQITAVGRRAERMGDLPSLGATNIIELEDDPTKLAHHLAEAGKDVDVALDFLWGEPTKKALHAIVPNRTRDEQLLTWIEIGSMAGLESPIPSAALRAINLRIIGSGQGSVAPRDYRKEVGKLAKEIVNGTFASVTKPISLSEVEQTWSDTSSSARIVYVP